MRVENRRYRDEWLPNYYPSRAIGEWRVRVSRTGKTQMLTPEEDRQLNEIFMDERMFERLERTGHIITADNALRVLQELKKWQSGTYSGPHLHIVVTTKRCNLNCTFCHMNPVAISSSRDRFDLRPEVANAIIRFALASPSPSIKFEFQGGESFLNFPGMVHFVEEARKQNELVGKQISFTVVSNLMVATDEQLEYCQENGISVSYTLNGPEDLHDHFRKSRSGAGSFAHVIKRLDHIQERFPGLLSSSPLCVVGADNAPHLERMLDFFFDTGFRSVSIIKLKHLGNAKQNDLRFDIREFLSHYLRGLDYIYEKNRDLREVYAERSLRVVLSKILSDTDIGFVDWRNPIGDVSGALTYDYDGEILPSDEARSLRREFGLGNVMNTTYEELVRRKETFRTMNLSLRDRDPECRECPYNPYCHVLPVLDYARTGDPTPRPFESEECLLTLAVLDWTFEKLNEDPLPLVRMIPGIDNHLLGLLEQGQAKGNGRTRHPVAAPEG